MHLRLRLVAAALSAGIVLAGCSTPIAADEEPAALSATTTPADAPTTSPSASPSASPSGSPSPTEEARPPSSDGRLEKVETIAGDISPKSVTATGTGLVFAQNMMYTHTVTVYDARRSSWSRRSPTRSTLVPVRRPDTPGIYRGCAGRGGRSPRTAGTPTSRTTRCTAPASDRGQRHLHAGVGLPRRASCTGSTPGPRDRPGDRGRRGAEVRRRHPGRRRRCWSPTGARYDLSVVDVAAASEVRRIPMGRIPGHRGAPRLGTAWVAVMGDTRLVEVDLTRLGGARRRRCRRGARGTCRSARTAPTSTSRSTATGSGRQGGRRHRRDRGDGADRAGTAQRRPLRRRDGALRRQLRVRHHQPRFRTADMRVVQTVDVGHRPIGITWDDETRQLWVASYSGTIAVFQDGRP